MRNKYPGECYRCHQWVPAGEGHFERFGSGWRVQHADCAIALRGTPDPARQALTETRLQARAKGTGRKAQRARRTLRERDSWEAYADTVHPFSDEAFDQ